MNNTKKKLSEPKKRKYAPRRKVTKRIKIRSLKIVKKLSGVTRNKNKRV